MNLTSSVDQVRSVVLLIGMSQTVHQLPIYLRSHLISEVQRVHLVDQVRSVVVLIESQKNKDRVSRSAQISSGVDKNVSEEQRHFIL